jgi:putative glutamine amidotransferase
MPVESGFDDLPRTIRRFDGLLLCGGGDVDPQHYGSPGRSRHLYDVDAVADRYEMAVLRAAVDAELPVLAICRGMQLLNVAFGGTLHQHLPDLPWLMNHRYELHAVELEAGSHTALAMGAERVVGHSVHHQGVDRVGDGLVVAGTAPDGMVEALELGSGWVVGVQWHPEDTAPDDPANHGLFTALVSRACARVEATFDAR